MVEINSLVYQGLNIDGADHDDLVLYVNGDQGVNGLDLPQFDTKVSPRVGRPGVIGGVQSAGAVVMQARVMALTDTAMLKFRQAMKPRPNPTDETPLTFRGFGFPATHRLYVRPVVCDFPITPGGQASSAYVMDAAWQSSDGVIYAETQHEKLVASEAPQTTVGFQIPNAGLDIGEGPRTWELRWTAHGTTTGPKLRVDHADGTFEEVSFPGLTMPGGSVLTIGADLQPRVQGFIVSGYMRSKTEAGGPAPVARWWRLHPSNGSDGKNSATMSVVSGSFSGYCKTRGAW